MEIVWLGRPLFLIWRTNGRDQYLSKPSQLMTWVTIGQLHEYCLAQNIRLKHQAKPHRLDFDQLQAFVDKRIDLDCEVLLNFWNFFLDVEGTHQSAPFIDADTRLRDLYSAIFSRTSAGRIVQIAPSPIAPDDVTELRGLMLLGLSMLAPLL